MKKPLQAKARKGHMVCGVFSNGLGCGKNRNTAPCVKGNLFNREMGFLKKKETKVWW